MSINSVNDLQNLSGKQLISLYLKFFESKGHVIIPSAPLIPQNDPSVLFNTAGMQPLGPYLMGQEHPKGKRLCDVQKCLRTVDFENIGDNTHHTFFQMLGNWSLGDYFKKDAIEWSFEFLTSEKWLNLPLNKLAFTVYQGDALVGKDQEAFDLWHKLGVHKERIAFLGKDNFWNVGDVGPCGPSTEMFYWKGNGEAPKVFDPNDNNWVEIWNDVFMTYYKNNDTITPLKQKNVDTGMGLERVIAVLTGNESSYETDLFLPIIKEIEKISDKKYVENKKSFRIIADHIRATTFILAEKVVVPSNTDRGYVLRRLIRRAIVYGKKLGINNSFMSDLAKVVIDNYKYVYTELSANDVLEFITQELNKEEQKFRNTLERGLKEFEKIASKGNINGDNAFLLFQSYGFPIEMTDEMAKEKNINVDVKGFKDEFEKHQQASRVGAEKKFKGGLADTSDASTKLHTAAHLLNEALRKIISKDIVQKGSNITPERLRFDFNFDRKLTDDELKKIEDEVNNVISNGLNVVKTEMNVKDAFSNGYHGEFGAKYPDVVSVYTIGDYSKEICGGPHVKNTKDLGHFKITKEESVASGIRRIKAILE